MVGRCMTSIGARTFQRQGIRYETMCGLLGVQLDDERLTNGHVDVLAFGEAANGDGLAPVAGLEPSDERTVERVDVVLDHDHVARLRRQRDDLALLAAEAGDVDTLAVDLARRFEDAGVAAIIYTDIDRDGAMQGPNVAATAALAKAVSIPVIASGGIASLDDLHALKASGVPLDGAISGRALYEGRIDLGEAVRLLAA